MKPPLLWTTVLISLLLALPALGNGYVKVRWNLKNVEWVPGTSVSASYQMGRSPFDLRIGDRLQLQCAVYRDSAVTDVCRSEQISVVLGDRGLPLALEWLLIGGSSGLQDLDWQHPVGVVIAPRDRLLRPCDHDSTRGFIRMTVMNVDTTGRGKLKGRALVVQRAMDLLRRGESKAVIQMLTPYTRRDQDAALARAIYCVALVNLGQMETYERQASILAEQGY